MPESRFQRYVVRAQQFGARTVLFQHAAASRLGLTPTELETFRLIEHGGAITASELAKETGLTRASMSAIVDKLANAGFVERHQDPDDRRRWRLEAIPQAVAKVDALYAAHAVRVTKLLKRYSDDDFEIVLDFMSTLAAELKDTAVEMGEVGSDT